MCQFGWLTTFLSDTTMVLAEEVLCLGPGGLVWEIPDTSIALGRMIPSLADEENGVRFMSRKTLKPLVQA